jgi:pimeloyl-ACP methyl ester carboxylesterase
VERQNLRNVVLAGHSYGGMVITGVAGQMPRRIRRMVYIDAALPMPGESLFDQFARGGADPLSFAGLEAARAYVERIQYSPAGIRRIPKTYIRCTESEFTRVTRVAQDRIAARPDGWRYRELPTTHVPMATMPDRLNRLLLEALRP